MTHIHLYTFIDVATSWYKVKSSGQAADWLVYSFCSAQSHLALCKQFAAFHVTTFPT